MSEMTDTPVRRRRGRAGEAGVDADHRQAHVRGGIDRSGYRRLSIGEKQALAHASAREPALACPVCDTQVMPADLLAHLEQRCTGPREPGPGAKWVTWREALAIVRVKGTIAKWVAIGRVRVQGELQDRRYLLRDLVICVARRREFTRVNRAVDGTGKP